MASTALLILQALLWAHFFSLRKELTQEALCLAYVRREWRYRHLASAPLPTQVVATLAVPGHWRPRHRSSNVEHAS